MMRRIACALSQLAVAAMPAPRRHWGEAMRAELDYIGGDQAAVIHAVGGLVAALRERGRDFETRFSFAMWLIAAATALLACFHLWCALRGIRALLGGPDGFLDAMMRSGAAGPELVERYLAARPMVVACLVALGITLLMAARSVHRWQLKRLLVLWCAAMTIAVVAVAIQLSIVWTLDGMPSEFLALAIQAVSLPLLLLWSNGRHLRLRSAR